jgi:hypothetical protein
MDVSLREVSGGSRIETREGLIKEDIDLQVRFNCDLMLYYSNCYNILVEKSTPLDPPMREVTS